MTRHPPLSRVRGEPLRCVLRDENSGVVARLWSRSRGPGVYTYTVVISFPDGMYTDWPPDSAIAWGWGMALPS